MDKWVLTTIFSGAGIGSIWFWRFVGEKAMTDTNDFSVALCTFFSAALTLVFFGCLIGYIWRDK